MGEREKRIVVALQPRIYETAVARLISNAGIGDVVAASGGGADGRFEIAVVDGSRPGIEADVVLQLPGTAPAGGRVVLDLTDRTDVIAVDDPERLLQWLEDDRGRPGGRSAG